MPDFYSIRLNPLDDVANQCTVIIFDNDIGTFDDELALIAAGNPLEFKIIDNSEDPFSVIKSTQATIRFISTAITNSNTFSSGADERWSVIVLRGDLSGGGLVIFKGYLVLNDITEDFMPIGNVVTLTATDGLGLLKEIPLQLPPPPPVTLERNDIVGGDGRWSGNSSILNNSIEIDIRKKNLDGTPIWWVPTLKAGSQITIVFISDPTQRASYHIDSIIYDFGDYIAYNVTVLSGTDYGTSAGEQFSVYIDSADLNPRGPYKIIDYIAWCLQRTNVSIIDDIFPSIINVAFNIKLSELISDISVPNSDPQHLFDTVYLDAKTFEDEIGTCINCYEVLQRILGEEACLFHRDGQWWIVRIEELGGQAIVGPPPPPPGSIDVFISNNLTAGVLVDVVGISGYTLPSALGLGDSDTGTGTPFLGDILITITGAFASGSAELWLNGGLQETLLVTGANDYDFSPLTYVNGDSIQILLTA